MIWLIDWHSWLQLHLSAIRFAFILINSLYNLEYEPCQPILRRLLIQIPKIYILSTKYRKHLLTKLIRKFTTSLPANQILKLLKQYLHKVLNRHILLRQLHQLLTMRRRLREVLEDKCSDLVVNCSLIQWCVRWWLEVVVRELCGTLKVGLTALLQRPNGGGLVCKRRDILYLVAYWLLHPFPYLVTVIIEITVETVICHHILRVLPHQRIYCLILLSPQ